MRVKPALLLSLILIASTALAGDRWIPIAGTVGNFRTDSRVFNPSFDKDIEVEATLIRVGDGTQKVGPVKFTVKKREMKVFDDVVASLFTTDGLGAILLHSTDDFLATSRIFAIVATGTLGQFSVADAPETAQKQGVLIQLKSGTAFRTNVGAVNISSTATANVTWRLYDKANAVIATTTRAMTPNAVLGPSNVAGLFTIPAGSDVTDAWVSFSSDSPIFAYGSVVDNGTTDQTFVPGLIDTGVAPAAPEAKVLTIVAHDFAFDVTSTGGTIHAGDEVTVRMSSTQGTHGFRLTTPNFDTLIDLPSLGSNVVERKITFTSSGTYFYACTVSTCGVGHTAMNGSVDVGAGGTPPGNPRY
jgi:heme/copper-type cytochrome/quinol oxidase subunit 2